MDCVLCSQVRVKVRACWRLNLIFSKISMGSFGKAWVLFSNWMCKRPTCTNCMILEREKLVKKKISENGLWSCGTSAAPGAVVSCILKEAKQKMVRNRNAVMCGALKILLLLVTLRRPELEFEDRFWVNKSSEAAGFCPSCQNSTEWVRLGPGTL